MLKVDKQQNGLTLGRWLTAAEIKHDESTAEEHDSRESAKADGVNMVRDQGYGERGTRFIMLGLKPPANATWYQKYTLTIGDIYGAA